MTQSRLQPALWALASVAVLSSLVLVFFTHRAYDKFTAGDLGKVRSRIPKCESNDAACFAWLAFRRTHAFPSQAMAAQRLPNGDVALVISEPPLAGDGEAFLALATKVFGSHVRLQPRLREWPIGVDGSVVDLTLTFKPASSASADLLADPQLRDRISLLHVALFGTSFGAELEIIDPSSALRADGAAPNVQVSALEVTTWLSDGSPWQSLASPLEPAVAWQSLAAAKVSGAYLSSDGTLAMLTFPSQLVRTGAKGLRLAPLRVPFREFAIASDAVFGGAWTADGQVAILARARRTPLAAVPPLRFETAELLAAAATDVLSQSIVEKGASVELMPPSLINTELGGLMTLANQGPTWERVRLLAGRPEPNDEAHPAAARRQDQWNRISSLLTDPDLRWGWDNAGFAVVVEGKELSTLTVWQTGSLPVSIALPEASTGEPSPAVRESLRKAPKRALSSSPICTTRGWGGSRNTR